MPKVSAIPQLVSAQWKTAGIMLCLMSGVRSFVGVITHGPPSFTSFRKETVTTICGALLYSTTLLNTEIINQRLVTGSEKSRVSYEANLSRYTFYHHVTIIHVFRRVFFVSSVATSVHVAEPLARNV